MNQSDVLSVFQEAIIVTVKLAAPLLVVSIAIGLIVAIFQAATQIHEQTLTFVPKVIASGIILWVLGSWMISVLSDFMKQLFALMSTL